MSAAIRTALARCGRVGKIRIDIIGTELSAAYRDMPLQIIRRRKRVMGTYKPYWLVTELFTEVVIMTLWLQNSPSRRCVGRDCG